MKAYKKGNYYCGDRFGEKFSFVSSCLLTINYPLGHLLCLGTSDSNVLISCSSIS